MSHKGVIVCGSDAQFTELLRADPGQLVCIDFMATWCGPCKAIAPIVEELAFSYPHVRFLQVDVDRLRQAAAMFSISAMPTFILYRDGQTVQKLMGANPNGLRSAVATHAPPPPKNAGQGSTVKKSNTLLPTQHYINIEGSGKDILTKIVQKITEAPVDKLSDAEVRLLASVVDLIAGTSYYHSSKLNDPKSTFSLFEKLLDRPLDHRFPVVDLLRQLVIHPNTSAEMALQDVKSNEQSLLGRLITIAATSSTLSSAESTQYALKMMIWRFIANAMYLPDTRKRIMARWAELSSVMEVIASPDAKWLEQKAPLRVAVASVVLNASVDAFDQKDSDAKLGLTPLLLLLGSGEADADVMQRVLASIGTIAYEDELVSDVMREGALIFINRVTGLADLARLKPLAEELRKLVDTFDPKSESAANLEPVKKNEKVLPW